MLRAEDTIVTIMNRKAVEFWGKCKAQPDLAYVTIDYTHRRTVVTWADVMKARRERQRIRLESKRSVVAWRAYKLWVAYFDQDLMGGWHAFLEDYRGDPYRIWIRADWLQSMLMQSFPLVPAGERDQWERWKVAFAKRFERRQHDNRPVGVAYLWWDGRNCPRLQCNAERAIAVGAAPEADGPNSPDDRKGGKA